MKTTIKELYEILQEIENKVKDLTASINGIEIPLSSELYQEHYSCCLSRSDKPCKCKDVLNEIELEKSKYCWKKQEHKKGKEYSSSAIVVFDGDRFEIDLLTDSYFVREINVSPRKVELILEVRNEERY